MTVTVVRRTPSARAPNKTRLSSLLGLGLTYFFLGSGALFMLFPVFWMVSAALKPEWQIFTRPVIWVPQDWHRVGVGDTVRQLNLYTVNADGPARGLEWLQLGSRLTTTAIEASQLRDVQRVSSDALGAVEKRRVGDVDLNVRRWQNREVVAVGRDGSEILVAPLEVFGVAKSVPLSDLNAAPSQEVRVGNVSLNAQRLETPSGAQTLVNLGPNLERQLLAPKDAASQARLVPASSLTETELAPLGSLGALEQTRLRGSNERFVLLERSPWRATLAASALRDRASLVSRDAFKPSGSLTVNGATFPTAKLEGATVVNVLEGDDGVLVVPPDVLKDVRLVPAASLQRTVLESVRGVPVTIKDFSAATVRDENIALNRLPSVVSVIGSPQEMALLLPASALSSAVDVPSDAVARRMSADLKWQNFGDAMARRIGGASFLTFFRNSLVITVLSIIGHLASCTVVAYAFARLRAPGKNALFVIVLATMMLPEFVTLVPVYAIFRDLGMIDTLTPMYIRSFFGNAFLIFLLRQFFSTIPRDLEEAAMLDGATRFQTFTRIMLPLVTPALTAVTIFTFLWRWNDLFNAAIYLNSPENYTVSRGLQVFIGAYTGEFNLLMAAAVITMIPTILIFFFGQRFFIEGVTLTGVKG
jgi:multiple sugar transport system permease protein